MGADHQSRYHQAWPQLTAPLRPHSDVVRAVSAAIGAQLGQALLLGVTPELAGIAPDLVAVDRNLSMVRHVWPGDTASRRVLVADWKNMPFAPDTFCVCVGDGSLNTARYPDGYAVLFAELARVLRGGAALVLRTYQRPEAAETAAAVREAALAGEVRNFHAFKLRLGMALAGDSRDPNVPVQAILDAFNRMFPDRATLVRLTGWERRQVDTIDFYEGSGATYSFPSRQELLGAVPAAFFDIRIRPSGTYELAERCPLLTMRRT